MDAPRRPPPTRTPIRKIRSPHPCATCGKTFTKRSNMLIHSRLHTGEKPYGCKFAGCGKRYKWLSSINFHENRCDRRHMGLAVPAPRPPPPPAAAEAARLHQQQQRQAEHNAAHNLPPPLPGYASLHMTATGRNPAPQLPPPHPPLRPLQQFTLHHHPPQQQQQQQPHYHHFAPPPHAPSQPQPPLPTPARDPLAHPGAPQAHSPGTHAHLHAPSQPLPHALPAHAYLPAGSPAAAPPHAQHQQQPPQLRQQPVRPPPASHMHHLAVGASHPLAFSGASGGAGGGTAASATPGLSGGAGAPSHGGGSGAAGGASAGGMMGGDYASGYGSYAQAVPSVPSGYELSAAGMSLSLPSASAPSGTGDGGGGGGGGSDAGFHTPRGTGKRARGGMSEARALSPVTPGGCGAGVGVGVGTAVAVGAQLPLRAGAGVKRRDRAAGKGGMPGSPESACSVEVRDMLAPYAPAMMLRREEEEENFEIGEEFLMGECGLVGPVFELGDGEFGIGEGLEEGADEIGLFQ